MKWISTWMSWMAVCGSKEESVNLASGGEAPWKQSGEVREDPSKTTVQPVTLTASAFGWAADQRPKNCGGKVPRSKAQSMRPVVELMMHLGEMEKMRNERRLRMGWGWKRVSLYSLNPPPPSAAVEVAQSTALDLLPCIFNPGPPRRRPPTARPGTTSFDAERLPWASLHLSLSSSLHVLISLTWTAD